MKTRIAPVSAAIGRVQLAKLEQNNRLRNENMLRMSVALEELGFDCFLAPPHIERVYFEFLIRSRDVELDLPALTDALESQGCEVTQPRYPLLHQQPFFTEGHYRKVLRLGDDFELPTIKDEEFEPTAAENNRLLRLPVFPGPDDGSIDRYLSAFERAL